MKEIKTVKFGYARGKGFTPESFEDGVALLLPTGDVHITMWGGENSTYVSMSGTQNRLTHIVAVHTSCNSRIVLDDLEFQGDPHPAELGEVGKAEKTFVKGALLLIATKVAAHCDQASKDRIYGILWGAMTGQL